MLSSTPRTFVGSTTFRVDGMTCGHCERAITTHVGGVVGVDHVEVDLSTGTVTVQAGAPVDRSDITAAVQDAGYAVVG